MHRSFASHFHIVDISAADRLTNDCHAIVIGHQYSCFKCFSISTSSWQLGQFIWERWSYRPAEYWQHSKSSFAVSAVSSYCYKQCHSGNYSKYSFWYWVKVLWRHLIFYYYKCLGLILDIFHGGVHSLTLVFCGFYSSSPTKWGCCECPHTFCYNDLPVYVQVSEYTQTCAALVIICCFSLCSASWTLSSSASATRDPCWSTC